MASCDDVIDDGGWAPKLVGRLEAVNVGTVTVELGGVCMINGAF